MHWMASHWPSMVCFWMALNVSLSALGHVVPPAGFWGKALHVWLAINPMDIVRAYKTINNELIAGAVGAGLFAIVAAYGLDGCANQSHEELVRFAIAAYATEMRSCVELAATKRQADDCRLGVVAYYCGHGSLLGDAGACEGGSGK